jgi:cyclic pyranopterin monophosphate synthase
MPGDGKTGDGVFDDGSRAATRRAAHFERIRRPRMTDVTDSPQAARFAIAEAEVGMAQETLSSIIDGANAKGDVLSIAELAGVMAGKRTADLIPLVHPAGLTQLIVNAVPDRAASAVKIRVETAAYGPTGVEMEAVTAAAVAALTVYDMIREIEPGAVVRSVKLVGSSGDGEEEWRRPGEPAENQRPPKGVRTAGRIVPAPRGGVPSGPGQRRRTP